MILFDQDLAKEINAATGLTGCVKVIKISYPIEKNGKHLLLGRPDRLPHPTTLYHDRRAVSYATCPGTSGGDV
jgi:hypothetical protein